MKMIKPFILGILIAITACQNNSHKGQQNQVKLLLDAKAKLGEGAIWHPVENRLYWIDIEKGELNIYDPVMESFEYFQFSKDENLGFDPNAVASAIQDRDGEIWLICDGNTGLLNIDEVSDSYRILRPDPESVDSQIGRASCRERV